MRSSRATPLSCSFSRKIRSPYRGNLSFHHRIVATAAALLLAAGCTRHEKPIRRVAIVPANVLIADSASDWMRIAIPVVLETDLATAPGIASTIVSHGSEAYRVAETEVLRATVEERQGRFDVRAVLSDTASQRALEAVEAHSLPNSGLIAALNQLAEHVDSRATPFSTKNDSALHEYANALTAADTSARLQALQNAIAADPNFGLAYLFLLDIQVQRGISPAATLQAASLHHSRFSAIDDARFQALTARLSRRPVAEQAKAAAAVLHIAPNDLSSLTAFGTAQFLLGKPGQGEASFARAEEVAPANTDVQEQLALGLIEAGRFKDAEPVLTGLQARPNAALQLAVCVLLEGDKARANSIFSRYAAARQAAHDPLLPLAEANWLAITARMEQGIALLKQTTFTLPDLHSLALSQAAVWELSQKQPEAKADATEAMRLAQAPVAKAAALAPLLISSAASSDQLRTLIAQQHLDQNASDTVLGYGYFFSGDYTAAVSVWQKIVNESGGADLRARAILTACLHRTHGKQTERAIPFLPNLSGGDNFAAIAFNAERD